MTPQQRELLQEGIRLFNLGQFFECHEVLEQAWLESSGEQKLFLQGLIQIAVSLHHLRQSNEAGAGRLLAAGMEKLSRLSGETEAVDISALLASLEPLRRQLHSGQVPQNWPVPQISCKTATPPPEP